MKKRFITIAYLAIFCFGVSVDCNGAVSNIEEPVFTETGGNLLDRNVTYPIYFYWKSSGDYLLNDDLSLDNGSSGEGVFKDENCIHFDVFSGKHFLAQNDVFLRGTILASRQKNEKAAKKEMTAFLSEHKIFLLKYLVNLNAMNKDGVDKSFLTNSLDPFVRNCSKTFGLFSAQCLDLLLENLNDLQEKEILSKSGASFYRDPFTKEEVFC